MPWKAEALMDQISGDVLPGLYHYPGVVYEAQMVEGKGRVQRTTYLVCVSDAPGGLYGL